jgi:hypothetical protein
MAAGLGFKTFTTGEVLTAGDVNGYLMQGILVFATSTARDAAITSPQEGQFAYLKDTNTTTYYTGSAWTNVDTTGMVNPMTTTGDTIYSSSGSTPARLGIGSTGQVLTVSDGVPSWATVSSGGMTLLSTTTLSGASTTISSISGSYTNLLVFFYGLTNATSNSSNRIAPNGSTNISQGAGIFQTDSTSATFNYTANRILLSNVGVTPDRTNANNSGYLLINNYANTSSYKTYICSNSFIADDGTSGAMESVFGNIKTNSAITSLVFSNAGGNQSTGTVLVYGVK